MPVPPNPGRPVSPGRPSRVPPMLCSRRHFLTGSSMGIGSLALAWLLKQDGLLAAPAKPQLVEPTYDLLPKKPHFEPKAKAMISIFLIGGPSQIDLFD